MSDALNKKNFLSFSSQCKGAGVTAIDVTKAPEKGGLRLTYRARASKSRQVFKGEWTIAKDAEGGVEAAEKAFLEMAGKTFAITQRE